LFGFCPAYFGIGRYSWEGLVFICPNPENKSKENDPENRGLLPSELGTAIRVSMENGAIGICLFTPERMKPEHWEVFEKAIYMEYTKK